MHKRLLGLTRHSFSIFTANFTKSVSELQLGRKFTDFYFSLQAMEKMKKKKKKEKKKKKHKSKEKKKKRQSSSSDTDSVSKCFVSTDSVTSFKVHYSQNVKAL